MQKNDTKNGRVALLGGKVVTGTGEVWERGVVVIEAGMIFEAHEGEEYRSHKGDRVLQLAGHTVFPGIIDCHVHLTLDGGSNNIRQAKEDNTATATLRALRNAQAALAAGVTTLRDAGGKQEAVFAIRDWIRAGFIQGPRILACGTTISITGGHCWWLPGIEADGPQEVRHAVRGLIKAGADAIKLMATGGLTDPLSSQRIEGSADIAMAACQMEEEELTAAVIEAHKAGKKTFAHAHGVEGGKRAARAGVDSIDHGIFFGEDKEIFGLISERGLWYTPTVAATAPSPLKTMELGCPEHIIERHKVAYTHHRKSFHCALKGGVKLGYGTDSGSTGNPHGRNLREFSCMVELGLPPLDALECATSGAASLLGLSDVMGTLMPGKIADIVVAKGDIIQDPMSLSDPDTVRIVIQRGEVVIAKNGETIIQSV